MNQFSIRLDDFEGPIDLLLQLIEKRKLHISDINIASVTDDYINYINNLSDLPKTETADFLVTASTLILIKSISLLPTLEITKEERGDIEDLKKRLKLYEQIKNLSIYIYDIFGLKTVYFRSNQPEINIFAPSKDINLKNIALATENIVNNLPKNNKIKPEVAVKKVISLEEVIHDLTRRIQHSLSMSFNDFSTGLSSHGKIGIIVGFLSMLELVKQGLIDIKQDKHFEDITIENNQTVTPKY